jgi:hypothetical protein
MDRLAISGQTHEFLTRQTVDAILKMGQDIGQCRGRTRVRTVLTLFLILFLI